MEDVLVVWWLDRLGRSLKDLIELVNQLEERKISFKSLQDPVDTTSFPTGSPLREEINRPLLVLVENGTYDQIYTKWYGSISDQ